MIAGKVNLIMIDLELPGADGVDQGSQGDTANVLGQISECRLSSIIVRSQREICHSPMCRPRRLW